MYSSGLYCDFHISLKEQFCAFNNLLDGRSAVFEQLRIETQLTFVILQSMGTQINVLEFLFIILCIPEPHVSEPGELLIKVAPQVDTKLGEGNTLSLAIDPMQTKTAGTQ